MLAMPIYEYRCEKCGTRFELLRRRGERQASAPCPHCGSKKTRQVISAFIIGGRNSLFEDVSISPSDIPKPVRDTFPPGWEKKLGKHLG